MVDGNIMGHDDPALQPNPVAEQGQQAAVNDATANKVPKVSKNPDLPDIEVVDMHMEGNRLIVIVESTSSDRVLSTDARNLAYAQRFEKGMTNAGIEAICGMYVPDAEYAAAKTGGREVGRWRRDFRLTPGL
jgi:hypothetical protein